MLAILVERVDMWGRYHARQHGAKMTQLPEQIRWPRPGEGTRKRHIETDPRKIAAFFRAHIGEGPES